MAMPLPMPSFRVIEVQGRPSLGAKKVGTIPTESRQWPRSYVVVSVDKETWVKDKLWVHLANPWIFNAKVSAGAVRQRLPGPHPT